MLLLISLIRDDGMDLCLWPRTTSALPWCPRWVKGQLSLAPAAFSLGKAWVVGSGDSWPWSPALMGVWCFAAALRPDPPETAVWKEREPAAQMPRWGEAPVCAMFLSLREQVGKPAREEWCLQGPPACSLQVLTTPSRHQPQSSHLCWLEGQGYNSAR
ncbi:hypothetical protein P7K49_010035 [Saguinus oedipus]|uniref:Uncharacterized protein n=1 Tax=Saguinus oedipus TaxID=9490 RepID=A0ABQ9VN32_SAGOE|nr:hypothetical protein P7K49_010035 [Saguinus oedipus]